MKPILFFLALCQFSAATAQTVILRWMPPAIGPVVGYSVYSSRDNFRTAITNTTALDVTVQVDPKIVTLFQVRAFNQTGEGPASNTWTNTPATTPPNPGTIVITAPVLDRTNYVAGATVTGTATFINQTGSAFQILEGWLTARQPGASNASGPFDDFNPGISPQTLPAGAALSLTASWIVRSNAPLGTWTAHLAVKGADGYRDGPTTPFNVVAPGIPSAPQNLRGTQVTARRIDLRWDVAPPAAVKIQRAESPGAFKDIGKVSAGVYHFTDGTIRRGRNYFWRVAAFGQVNGQDWVTPWSNILVLNN